MWIIKWETDYLAHSKGAWKNHKYIRKEGEGLNAKYYYVTNASGAHTAKETTTVVDNGDGTKTIKQRGAADVTVSPGTKSYEEYQKQLEADPIYKARKFVDHLIGKIKK